MNSPPLLACVSRPLGYDEQQQLSNVMAALSGGYTASGGNVVPHGVTLYQLIEGRWVELGS